MSSNPVTAISGSYSGDPLKRFSSTTSMERVDLSKVDTAPTGAYIKVGPKLVPDPAVSAMNLQNLYTVVSDGMRDGFVKKQFDAIAEKFDAAEKPGSTVTTGELTKDMLFMSRRLAVADAFSKAANKLSESLMTLVKG
jgi:hypothetical protein